MKILYRIQDRDTNDVLDFVYIEPEKIEEHVKNSIYDFGSFNVLAIPGFSASCDSSVIDERIKIVDTVIEHYSRLKVKLIELKPIIDAEIKDKKQSDLMTEFITKNYEKTIEVNLGE